MPVFKIWSEGYRATGKDAPAHFHGEVEAESFKQACRMKFKKDPNYNDDKLSYWGCKLFDNEGDARKFNG